MSDSNNNELNRTESLEKFGFDFDPDSNDEDAFASDDASVASQTPRRYVTKKSRSRSSRSRHSSVTSRKSRGTPRKRKRTPRTTTAADDVIPEVCVTSHARTNSHPSVSERKSRLVRRRSAITFSSTYRSLSSQTRMSPVRTLVVASVASVPELCCYPAGYPAGHLRQRATWSNLMTCLAHKKENGGEKMMTRREILIRKSLE